MVPSTMHTRMTASAKPAWNACAHVIQGWAVVGFKSKCVMPLKTVRHIASGRKLVRVVMGEMARVVGIMEARVFHASALVVREGGGRKGGAFLIPGR